MAVPGTTGQLRSPFLASEDIISKMGISPGSKVKIGFSIDPDILIATPNLRVAINNKTIKLGQTGIYELDVPIVLTSMYFTEQVPFGLNIDYVIYN